jgi:hypothetical protein
VTQKKIGLETKYEYHANNNAVKFKQILPYLNTVAVGKIN